MTNQTEQGAAILPCPLCGAEAQLVDFAGYEVLCACGLNYCDGTDASAEAAARGWNRRATIPTSEGCTLESWRPIETAPEGCDVLLWSPKFKRPHIGDWRKYIRYNLPKYTHWMPLPAAPVATPGDSHAT